MQNGWHPHKPHISGPLHCPFIVVRDGTVIIIPVINPIERLNGEIKRRTRSLVSSPNDGAIVRLVGALLLEQNDEWAVQRARYMTLETISQTSDDPLISLPAVAR
ncbi:hypothetical protein X727_30995 [Mesorhizobium sp. L103C119B0]|nr:hypothetical protein X727_30995 [Mesorhizobium sp. L103C119B0]